MSVIVSDDPYQSSLAPLFQMLPGRAPAGTLLQTGPITVDVQWRPAALPPHVGRGGVAPAAAVLDVLMEDQAGSPVLDQAGAALQ